MTTAASSPIVVAGDEALAEFRQGLTGAYALDLLNQAQGLLLVSLPVGVGKSEWLIRIILYTLAIQLHDLIVVLVPCRDILRELLQRLPPALDRVVLTPRPRKQCGDLDPLWVEFESSNCGALGRVQLCPTCPRVARCPWPGQYGSRLRGARLILATQQHLVLNPSFLIHLQQQAGASNSLLLLDESDLLIRATERVILANDLAQFIDAQVPQPGGTGQHARAASP